MPYICCHNVTVLLKITLPGSYSLKDNFSLSGGRLHGLIWACISFSIDFNAAFPFKI